MSTPESPPPDKSPLGEDALLRAILGESEHPVHVRLKLIQSGLAEVVDVDGVPTLKVDPIFELARSAALAGIVEAEAVRDEELIVPDDLLADLGISGTADDPDGPADSGSVAG